MKHLEAPLVPPAPSSGPAGHGPVARLAAVLVLLASGLLAAPVALAASSIKLTWTSGTSTLALAEQTVDGDGQLTVSVNGSGNLALTLGSGTFDAASTAAGGALSYSGGSGTPATSSTATINLTSSSVSKLSIDLLAGAASALTFTGVNKPTKLFAVDIKSGGTLTLNQLQVRDIVTAVVGSVGSTQTGSSNVTVPKLQLLGTNGIGTSANPLDTAAGNIELNTVTGDIQVANTGDVILGGVTTLPPDYTTATTIGVQVKTSGAIGFSTTGTLFIQNINETFKAPGDITIVAGTGVVGYVMKVGTDPRAVESSGGAVSITATTGDVRLGAYVTNLRWYADISGNGVTILAPQGSIVMDYVTYITSTGGPVVLTAKTAVRFLKSGGYSGASLLTIGVSPVSIEAGTFEASSSGSVASAGGNCTVTADELVLAYSNLRAPTNFTLWVKPLTANRPIDLGLGTASGALGITAVELTMLNGGTVRIGGPDAGALSVTAPVTRPLASKLRLDSGVSVTQVAGATITDGSPPTSGYLLVSSPNATLDQANLAATQTTLLDGVLTLSRSAGLAVSGGLVVGDGIGTAGSAVVRLSYPDQFLATKILTVYDDGLFDMNGFNQTVAGLTSTGTARTSEIALGSATLTSTHSTNTIYSGRITGTGTYVKQGTGSQMLNGTGTVKGSITAGTLGGNGSLGAVTVTAATVAPGLASPGIPTGIFTFGSLTLDGTSTVKLDVNPVAVPVAGTNYDQVVIGSGGSVNLGGAKLTLNVGATGFVASASYTLIDNRSSSAVVGTFNGLPEGSTVTLGGVSYVLSYAGGDGNDVVLKNSFAAPTLTGINPTSGPTGGGTSVTITGTNLTGAIAVTIGGAACTALSANTATSITCTTPAGTAGARDVIVTTGGGSATGSGLFTYLASISPSTQTLNGTVGTAITPSTALTPIGFGGVVTYAISPSLPTGLSLNTSTGDISGTPTASQASAAYTITGTGATSGTATTAVSIAIAAAPALSPASQTVTGTAGVTITPTTAFTPSGFGGTVSYAVSPALPSGLSLSTSTGVVSGTPVTAQLATTYTVTGTGSTSGVATATVSLAVSAALSPATQTIAATKDLPLTPTAVLTPAGFSTAPTFAISTGLTAGLSFNTTTGVISGTPTALQAESQYTITATGGGVSATATVTLTVSALAVPSLSPATQSLTGMPGTALTPSAAYTGATAATFSIRPPLLDGLTLDTTTGVISGTPTVNSPAGGALASWYANTFDTSDLKGATATGSASWKSSSPGPWVELTPASNSQAGSFFVLGSAGSGVNAQAYRTSFDMYVSNPNPAGDGMSYSFTDNPDGANAGGEVGAGTRLSIAFHLYAGNASSATGIRVMYGTKSGSPGTTPGSDGVLAYSSNMGWAGAKTRVVVQIDALGRLTLTLGSTGIFDQVQLPDDYLTADRSSWQHVFKARTGSAISQQGIGNLTIQQSGPGAAQYTVTAINPAGSGTAAVDLTVGALPGAPTNLAATIPGTGQATISFTPPAGLGFGYQYSLDGTNWLAANVFNDAFTIGGLSSQNTILLRAVNSIGAGPSASIAVGTPAAPTGLAATPGNGRATISFTPGADGGSPVTSFEYSLNAGSSWTSTGSFTSPVVVTGLTNGSPSSILLRGVNALGNGIASSAVSVTPVADPPDIPAAVTAVANSGASTVTVSWTAPDTGGAAISSYTVQMTTTPPTGYAGPTGCAGTNLSLSCTATGLAAGTYFFRVQATNTSGSGGFGYTASGATIANLRPKAPTSLVATPADKQARIAFVAPTQTADNGDIGLYPVTDYEYSLNGTTWTSAGTATTPAIITNLTNGTSYTVYLRAVNAAGAGAASTSVSVTPATAPGAPTITSATALTGGSLGQVSIAFSAGATGGSALTNYEYSINAGSWITRNPVSTSSPLAISSGLTKGVAAVVGLRAVNAVGAGPADTASVVPLGVPDAPTDVTAMAASTQATVSWAAPANTGGATISAYTATSSSGSKTCTTSGTGCTVTGLTNGTPYTFTVVATNTHGPSAPSSPSASVTPGAIPGAPQSVSAAAGNAQATVSWSAPSANTPAASSYTVVAVQDSTKTCTTSSTNCIVTGLTNGTAYSFGVKATNSIGTGPAGTSGSVTPRTVPGAPLAVSATAGNAQVTVSWAAPTSNGGSAITGYSVTGSPGGSCTTAGATTCTVSPLSNGTSYTFEVKATNAAGTGAGASASATPALPALTPSSQTITATAGTAMTPTAALTSNSSFVGTVTYGIAPAVPTGLSFNSGTGVVSGTPSAAQSSISYTITGTGATSGLATATLAIAVGPATQGVLSLSAAPNPVHVNGTSLLSTGGGSGSGAVSYAVANGDPCSISGSTLTGIGAGSCAVTATKAADGTYGAATSSPVAVTVTLGPQAALVASASPTSVKVNGASSLYSTGGSGGGAVTYAVASGDPCTVSGSTLAGTGAGSCTVTATKAADAVYAAATSDPVTVSVSRNTQAALFVSASPTTISVNGASILSSSGGSGEGAVSYALVSGPCTLVGNQLTGTGVGTCSVSASKAESVAYSAATSSPIGVIVGLSPQTALSVLADPTTIKTGEWSQLTTTGGSGGGAVTYQVLSGPCILDGTRLTSASAGSCSVSASKAAEGNYASVTSAPMTVTVGLSPQSALSVLAAPSTIAVNDVSTLSSTGGSGTGAVTYALVSGPCSLEVESLTGTGAGSCSVTASKAADLAYAEATSSPITVTVGLSPQSTLSVSAAPTSISVNGSSALGATGGSGAGSVSYTLLDGPCSLAGSTLTGTGSGSCRITATKAADTSYASAVSAPLTLTVALAPQSSLSLLATPSVVNVGDSSVLAATGGSGSGSVTYALVGGPCSLSGSALSGMGAGSCVVTASKGADATYAATTSGPVTLTVGLAPQSALSGLADASTITVLGSSILSATGGSGSGAVTFALLGGPCSISGDTLNGLAAGSCSVSATKAEDSSYAAATSAPFTVTVGLAPQSTLEIQADPSALTVNGVSQLGGTGGSGTGSLSYSLLSGPCSLSGSALTGLGAGSCAVNVSKAADGTYAVATSDARTVPVGLAAQTPLSVSAAPTAITVNTDSILTTGGGSGGGAVSYQLLSGPCSISGATLTGLGEGGCTVVARKSADAAYAETTSGSIVVTSGLSAQSPLSLLADPTSISSGGRSALGTSGGSGTGVVSYSLLSGPCSLSGSLLTGIAAGSCSVAATKEADTRYAAATSAALPVTVGLTPQPTLTLTADPATINVTGSSTLSTSGGAGSGLVSYGVVSGPCSVSGSLLTGTGPGICSVEATKAADTTYASATSAPVTVTVGLAPQSSLTLLASPTTIDVNGTSALATTGGSGTGTVTYVLVGGPCSLSGSTLTGLQRGSCTVTATKAADATYASATSPPVTVTVGLAPQSSLALLASPTTVWINATATLSTTGGSGTGAVTYALVDGPCSLSASTLTGLQLGSCSVTATKAADVAYAQATSAAATVTVELAPQMPLAVVPSPTWIAAGGASTLTTTGGSGTGAVTYALVDGPCTLSGATLTALQKGSCWVTGTKAADATYAQVTSAPATVAVELIPQTPLTVRSEPSMLDLGPTLAGQGGSGSGRILQANPRFDGVLAVTGGSGTGQVFYTLLGGPCRLTGITLTGLDRGSCSVAATREADEVYARVTSEPVTVTVGLVPQSALALLADPSTVAVHGTGTLISTGGSGTGAVTYALVGGPCALSGATFTGIAAGSCSFTATKEADVTYATATSSPITITVGQSPQATLTLFASSGRIAANGTSALTTTGGSGSGVVTFSLIGGSCSLSGSTLTGLRAGPCDVSATKAADATYAEASAAPATVTVILAPQQALAASASPASIPVAGTSNLGSSGGSGGGAVTFSLAGGPCSLSGSTLTGLAAGSCVFTATKAEDAVYTQATSAPATVNVALSTQATLVLTATPSTVPVLSSALLATTGGSGGGLVTFALTSGSCSLSGNRLAGLSAGSCVVTASKAADGSYASATSSPITVTVGVGTASQLAFTTNPSATAMAGAAWAQQPVVTAQDASGNTDPSFNTPVILAIATGTGTLTCTTNPVRPVAGVATFSGCKVDAVGTFTLKATSGSFTNSTTNPSVVIVAESIPTLGTLGMIGLGVLLGLAGIVVLRRLV